MNIIKNARKLKKQKEIFKKTTIFKFESTTARVTNKAMFDTKQLIN